MKKLLVFAFAAIGMVACVKEEVALLPKGDAICFENAFIDNATRAAVDPSITTATLSGFNVWGFVKEYDGEIFNGVEVTKNNNVWSYEGTQYWVPNQPYYFAALAPMNSANWRVVSKATGEEAKKGLGLVYFKNVNGSEDLLYAKDMVTSKGINEDNGSVKFQFQHLLSKVKFTFKNGFPTETASIKITNVKMTTPDSGEIDLANIENGWSLDGADLDGTTLEFGDVEKLAYTKSAEVAQERLTIPASADQHYTITFDVELFMGAQSVYEVSKTSVVTGHELAMGNAYNFIAEINPANLELEEIEFDVEDVEGWVPEGGQQVDVDYYYNAESNTYSVKSAEGLAQVAAELNAGDEADAHIVLAGDVDLNDLQSRAIASNWTPIGSADVPFTGSFDGNGYTIKNLTLVETEAKEGKAYIGFFGYANNATIKNVTFENVYINIPCLDIDHSQGHIGAVAGSLEGTSTIENVTVKGDITVYTTQDANGASRVAVIAGGNSFGNVTMTNVHVIANQGSSLIANNNVGALAGQLQGKMVFENCSSNIDVTANKFFAGGLVGIAAGDSYIKNCHTTGDVAVVAGREGRHNDEYRVGGIAGGWADGKTKVFTLEGCSYTGAISGKNSDGAVVENFDYMGYVGRGYTLANCAGSKVVIDGLSFIQKYDAQYGIYDLVNANGVAIDVVSDAEALATALKSQAKDIAIMLTADIDCPITSLGQQTGGSGEYKLAGESTETILIDLNGHKLNITTTYWSVLGAKNDNAVFAIKNGTMTSSQTTGTWNSYDLCFANCNYNFENVVFEKAIALEGANKAYSLKNVSVTETHDYYAIWVSAKGQNITIDGLTINSAGRGIKIDEQYVSSPAKVTMSVANATFKSAKKAAIVVKSVEGAEINWGAGNDISNVAADDTFGVWVDEASKAYADKVVVNGVPSKVEGATSVLIYTADDLNNLSAKNAYVVLKADIDFQGAAMTKPIELWGDSTFDGQGHTISNVKTAVQGGYATSLFRGDANSGNKVVKNLVIENLTTPDNYKYAAAIWSDLQGANIEIDNVEINNSTISANGTIGGFVGFVSGSSTSVVIKNSSINDTNLNGGEEDHKRGAIVGRAYGCVATCENVVVDNVKINDVAATTSTLVGDKGYTGTVTVK